MAIGDAPDKLIALTYTDGRAPGATDYESESLKPPDRTDKADIKPAPSKWTDAFALRAVLADFSKFSQFRMQHWDQRWTDNDRILHANVEQKTWPGTDVPRASIGVKLEQQQLESLLPYLHEGIFSAPDGIWFDLFPRPTTPPDAAIAAREFMAMQTDYAEVEAQFQHVFRSLGHHGTGCIKVSWCKKRYDRAEWKPATVANRSGYGGQSTMQRSSYTEYQGYPEATYVSLRDLYVDSSLKVPDLQKAQVVIQRGFIGYDELLRMAESDKDYKIPGKAELQQYMSSRSTPKEAPADSERRQSLSEAGQTEIHMQGTTDPARARFEVLEYWSQDRFVVVLERKWLICNKKNPYGFIPYRSCNFQDVLDSLYGKGLAEILEYEQMLQQGLINSHLDEVALIIHGALVVQVGSVQNKNELRPRPGQVIFSTNAETGIRELKRSAVTQDWFIALQQSQMRAQQYTGLSDIITQGAPGVASSVTRTARGVSALAGAAHSRIQYVIERIENRMIVPMLGDFIKLNKLFLDPQKRIPVLGPNGAQALFDPLAILNHEFRVELRAGSKMAAKSAMQQTLPIVLQTVMAAIEPMRQQGVKTNIPAIVRDMLEAYGWRNRNDWFKAMSPEEMQAMQQEQQGPEVQKQQFKAEREEARFDAQHAKMEEQAGLDILKDVLSKALEGKPAAANTLRMALASIGAEDA